MNEVTRFEKDWSRFIGTKYSVACNSATSGLHMALRAANVGRGDEVIVPALSPIMPAFAVLYCGGTPVFADVERDTFCLDWVDAGRKYNPLVKAIITIHLYGLYRSDILCNGSVIEDSAECVVHRMGCANRMIVHSFESSKHLSTGEGGMVSTDNEIYAQLLRQYGGLGYRHLTAEQGRTEVNPDTFHDPDYKRHGIVGYNYRMSKFQAKEGNFQMFGLETKLTMRQNIAQMYLRALEGCDWIIPQKGEPNSYFTFACTLERRDWKKFYQLYKEKSGDTFYAAWSLPYEEPALYGASADCPVAESLQRKMMQFKTNQNLFDAEKHAQALRDTWRNFK